MIWRQIRAVPLLSSDDEGSKHPRRPPGPHALGPGEVEDTRRNKTRYEA